LFKFIFSESFISSSVVFAMPIIFAALAALISNKAGILNINIEGSMSVAALVGALASHYGCHWMIGLLAAVLAAVTMSLILAYCSVYLRTDSTLAGIALNTFATGVSILILYLVLGVKGDSSQAPSCMVPDIVVPFLSKIPVVGILFRQNLMVYLGILCLVLVSFLLRRTKMGLRIKVVGYNPEAARAAGISVSRYRVYALIQSGIFAGLGGAFLSMVYLSYFSVGMVAGKGFIGLAAEAMGGGVPVFTALFAFLFGAVDYFSVGAQSVLGIPYQLLNTLPYLMAMLALVIYSVRQRNNKMHI
jgi:ABC-type uncharacterized transport system permease subunit